MPLPFILAGLGLLGTVLGAKRIVKASIPVVINNHRLGHRKGEGPLTPREGGLGIWVGPNSTSMIGREIDWYADRHAILKTYRGKLLEATASEAEDLNKVFEPVRFLASRAEEANSRLVQIKERFEQIRLAAPPVEGELALEVRGLGSQAQQCALLIAEYEQHLAALLPTVVLWLERFPTQRVSTPTGKILALCQE